MTKGSEDVAYLVDFRQSRLTRLFTDSYPRMPSSHWAVFLAAALRPPGELTLPQARRKVSDGLFERVPPGRIRHAQGTMQHVTRPPLGPPIGDASTAFAASQQFWCGV